MSADYVILFLQQLPIRVSSIAACSSTKSPQFFVLSHIIYMQGRKKKKTFRLPRGLLLSECTWTFIQLIQNENARCEHLIIQLGAGASSPKESRQKTAFQR